MTERKPPGLGWESWIDRQIRQATERGEFDDLPGTGEPLPDLDKPFDEMGWVKRKLEREGLTYVPPSVALRRDAHEAREKALNSRSESEARRIIEAINDQIRAANRKGIPGPSLPLRAYDVERVVREWREGAAHRNDSGRAGQAPR
jgi:hypothetical protein